MARICRSDLIVVDDIGMLPAGQDAAEAFYRLVDAAYERRSVAVDSNLHPSGFDELMPKTLATATVDNRSTHGFSEIRSGQRNRISAGHVRSRETDHEASSESMSRYRDYVELTRVILSSVVDSRSRLLSVVRPADDDDEQPGPQPLAGEPGLANVVTLQRRKAAEISDGDEESFFLDTVAEYQWARDAAGLAPATLDGLTKPIIEVCQHYGLAPWRLTPRQVDKYFAGAGKRAPATVRRKMNQIDGYFAFLEQRYAGEIARRYGVAVESPVDPFNRPRHRGDFGLRVPPSHRAVREFFVRWRGIAGAGP